LALVLGSAPGLVPLLAGPGFTEAGPVSGAMTVTVMGKEIKVHLIFHNHTRNVVWLEKIEEGQAPARAEFEIRTDGRLVPYQHPTPKRPPFTRNDFFKLEPGQTCRREIAIDDLYNFPEGDHAYVATHGFLTWNDKTREARYRHLKPVRFTYAR
jgi:hypothetical protein